MAHLCFTVLNRAFDLWCTGFILPAYVERSLNYFIRH